MLKSATQDTGLLKCSPQDRRDKKSNVGRHFIVHKYYGMEGFSFLKVRDHFIP